MVNPQSLIVSHIKFFARRMENYKKFNEEEVEFMDELEENGGNEICKS